MSKKKRTNQPRRRTKDSLDEFVDMRYEMAEFREEEDLADDFGFLDETDEYQEWQGLGASNVLRSGQRAKGGWDEDWPKERRPWIDWDGDSNRSRRYRADA